MNLHLNSSPASGSLVWKNSAWVSLPVFWGSLLLAVTYISGDSYWIDEGNAMAKAVQASLGGWWKALLTQGGSDSQMPVYMFYIWIWQKWAGNSEWFMRLSNLPFFILAACYLRRMPAVLLFVAVSPFTAYYLNELRPYAMQIAAGAVIWGSLVKLHQEGKGHVSFVVGLFMLCGSSLLGVIWVFCAVGFLVLSERKKLLSPQWLKLVFLSAPVFGLLGLFYLYTLMLGCGGASMGGNVLLSMAQVGYELIGAAGLGPGRIELREHPSSLKEYIVPIALLLIVTTASLIFSLRRICSTKATMKIFWHTSLCVAGVFIIFAILILAKDFRLLGRHCSPAVILMAVLFSFTISNAESNKKMRAASLMTGFFLSACLLFSSLQLRLSPRHKKDDYKGAASIAKKALRKGKNVYWLADAATAEIYSLNGDDPLLQKMGAWKKGDALKKNSLIIFSKPDIYDPTNAFPKAAKSQNYHITQKLQAFTVWED